MDVQTLLDDIKQVIVRHIKDRFATRDAQGLAFDPEDRFTSNQLHVKAIPREGEDPFLQDQGLGLLRNELVRDRDRGLDRRELYGSHFNSGRFKKLS